jgi:hypothetical protein
MGEDLRLGFLSSSLFQPALLLPRTTTSNIATCEILEGRSASYSTSTIDGVQLRDLPTH